MRYAPYYDQFAAALCTALGAPTTRDNLDGPVAWIGGEAGWSGTNPAITHNNPLNIKYNVFRGFGITPDGEQRITNVDDGTQGYGTFRSLEAGATATAAYLQKGAHVFPQYGEAIAALRNSNVTRFLDAIARSPWAASHYGLPRTNHLLENLAYVRGNRPPAPKPQPQEQLVKFVQAYDPPKSIAAPTGTVLKDFAGNPIGSPLTTPTHLETIGLADAHSGQFVVRISTAQFYADKVKRPTWAIATIPNGEPQ